MRISIPGIFRPRPEPVSEAAPAPASSPPSPPSPPSPREVGETTERFGVPVTYMRSDIPEVDSAFGYGHLDGRRGVPPENFREFIAHTVEGEAIERLLAELETREREAREKAASLRSQRADLAARSEELTSAKARKEAAGRALGAAEEELREAALEVERLRDTASLSQATIYLVAALLFILGDVVMSQKIVADGLSLQGRIFNYIQEPWVFAFGLAMISIVLKPAYDRLIEGPYWDGKKKGFALTICILAFASCLTMGVLGAFRSVSHAAQIRIAHTSDAATIKQIQESLASSTLGWLAFVLSGVLFAVAGAVSLSIGLRYARQHRHVRRPARDRLTLARDAVATARNEQRSADVDLVLRTAEFERMNVLVRDEPEAAELDRRADEAASARRSRLEQWVEVRTLRLRSLYSDGYALGATDPDIAAESAERPRRKRPRPFVALRRAIRELSYPANPVN